MQQTLKIATRKSKLALWQANYVADLLKQQHPELLIELVGITTEGDKILDKPLSKVGGKGLFLKELQQALLDGRADIAVHSMKDVPAENPEGLIVPVILARANPLDAFVSVHFEDWHDLPIGAKVGTSSLRRVALLNRLRPDLNIISLRGNVDSRLNKLKEGQFDAIILAAAGLERLGLGSEIQSLFSVDEMLPAVGQGAIGIECRQGDLQIQAIIAPLNSLSTSECVIAERAMNKLLGGGCSVPVAGFAMKLDKQATHLELKAKVLSLDGKECIEAQATGLAIEAEKVGIEVADTLIKQGALELIAKLKLDEL